MVSARDIHINPATPKSRVLYLV